MSLASTTNYANRTVDVLAFPGPVAPLDNLMSQVLALPGQGGEVCTGIIKLAQRWLLEFMTETGSMLYTPDRGCDFLTQLRTGQLRTTNDVQQAFAMSAVQVQLNLWAEDPATAPDDELLASATLLSLTITGATLQLYIELLSQAGTTRIVVLPLAATV